MKEIGGPDLSGEVRDGGDLDVVARKIARRALLVGVLGAGMGIAGGGVAGYVLYENLHRTPIVQAVDPGMQAELDKIKNELGKQELAGCLNESFLRESLGAPPLASLDECREEHSVWWDKYNAPREEPTPEGTSG